MMFKQAIQVFLLLSVASVMSSTAFVPAFYRGASRNAPIIIAETERKGKRSFGGVAGKTEKAIVEDIQDAADENAESMKENFDDAKETVDDVRDNIKESAEDLLLDEEEKEEAKGMWEKTKDTLGDIKDTIKEKAVVAKDKVKDVAGSVKDKAVDAKDKVKDVAGDVKDKVKDTFTSDDEEEDEE